MIAANKSKSRSELFVEALDLLLQAYREDEVVETVGPFESFAERIRRLRARSGLTQEGIAKAAGLSTMAITQFETGRRKNPGIKTAIALAKALNVSLDELLGAK